MKNLISALSTFVLIVFIPAVFIGYLIKNDRPINNQSDGFKTNNSINNIYETSFKPGLIFKVKA